MNVFRLIKKNRNHDEKSFQFARGSLIETSVTKVDESYPAYSSEIAVLRKQITLILDALKDLVVNVRTQEFNKYNEFVELNKSRIDDAIDGSSTEVPSEG